MIKDLVNTICISKVVEPVVEEIAQDLLDMGRGPDHICLDRLGREWRVTSLHQQTE